MLYKVKHLIFEREDSIACKSYLLILRACTREHNILATKVKTEWLPGQWVNLILPWMTGHPTLKEWNFTLKPMESLMPPRNMLDY